MHNTPSTLFPSSSFPEAGSKIASSIPGTGSAQDPKELWYGDSRVTVRFLGYTGYRGYRYILL